MAESGYGEALNCPRYIHVGKSQLTSRPLSPHLQTLHGFRDVELRHDFPIHYCQLVHICTEEATNSDIRQVQ